LVGLDGGLDRDRTYDPLLIEPAFGSQVRSKFSYGDAQVKPRFRRMGDRYGSEGQLEKTACADIQRRSRSMGWMVSASDLITKQEDSARCVLAVFNKQIKLAVRSLNDC
jgi:hypothetical protein